mmetsp:Transcript_6854/g.17035  ORF Transcript_6854/g.17035 Transcript_6854/m.17035 type:complete len:372 (-) Transcript_6854:1892-3007(-)
MLGEDVVVNEALAARHTIRHQALACKPVQELLDRKVPLQDPAVPKRPRHLLKLELLWRDGLGHGKQRKRQVGEGVAVCLDGRAVEHLVQLEAHQPRGHGSGGGDGGDDSPGDELGLELVHLWNGVIARAHVAQPGDGVHVEVGIVVLLELNHRQPVISSESGAHGLQLPQQILDDGIVVSAHVGRGGGGFGVGFDFDAAAGLEGSHRHGVDGGGERSVVGGPGRSRHAVKLRLKVGHGAHERQVRRVRGAQRQRAREPFGRRPERRPGRGHGVLGKRKRQLRNFVVERVLEAQVRPRYALLVRGTPRREQTLRRLLHVFARLRAPRLPRRRRVLRGLGQIRVGLARGLFEHSLELGARPGQAVVDVVGERV